MIELDHQQWTRLMKEVGVMAMRMTHTKKDSLKATQRDRAHEAVQRAYERLERQQPDVRTVAELRAYLLGVVRSELHHGLEEGETRREYESAAGVEAETLGRAATPPAEVAHLDAARAERSRKRAALAVEGLRAELAAAAAGGSDKIAHIALRTVDLIDRGIAEPRDQAALLKCSIEEVYAARRRRVRLTERILAAIDAGDKDDKEDG